MTERMELNDRRRCIFEAFGFWIPAYVLIGTSMSGCVVGISGSVVVLPLSHSWRSSVVESYLFPIRICDV